MMIHGWKDIPHAWTGRIKTVTMKHTSHGNPQIQHNPCEITSSIFHRTRIKKIPKNLYRNTQNPEAKAILKKKNGAGRIRPLSSDYTTELQSSKAAFSGTKQK